MRTVGMGIISCTGKNMEWGNIESLCCLIEKSKCNFVVRKSIVLLLGVER
jgi:hypothetical protein